MAPPPPTASLPVDSRLLSSSDDQFDVLARWIAEVSASSDSLLDIGAGDGDDEYFGRLRPLVGRIVGVDPDPGAAGHAGLDDWRQATVEQLAHELAEDERFDLAVAVYVIEHVTDDPEGFFGAARACIRPGGSLFVITPNLWHYFGALARVATTLGLEDRLLRALQAGHAHTHHDGVSHFPVAYRANSVRALSRLGARAGFSALQIRHLENPAVFEAYFPGRTVAVPRAYSRLVHLVARPELFGTLICRFVAPASPGRPG